MLNRQIQPRPQAPAVEKLLEPPRPGTVWLILLLAVVWPLRSDGQDRLKMMPGYDRFQRMSKEIGSAVKAGTLAVAWKDEGKALEYEKNGIRYRFDVAARVAVPLPSESPKKPDENAGSNLQRRRDSRQRPPRPARARQFTSALSPDGKWKAIYKDRNLWVSETSGSNEVAVTTDGSEKTRLKYGTASWVYGEELSQATAMWWSTNSQKLAFYRFDESGVPDYYLTLKHTNIQDSLYVEPYNKAGAANPVVDVLVYDLASKRTVKVDVRSGIPFSNAASGHYVYDVAWSPEGSQLLFHRTDRLQKVMELCSADPESGACRVLVREEWPAS